MVRNPNCGCRRFEKKFWRLVGEEVKVESKSEGQDEVCGIEIYHSLVWRARELQEPSQSG
jgi:hypothetical protein